MKQLFGLIALAGAAIIAFAAFVPSASGQETSRVRVVHASPDAPAVDVYADGTKVLSDVAFKDASDYLSVPGGAHNFEVFAAGADPASDAPVIAADATLEAGTDYTIVAVGELAEIRPVVLTDDNSSPAAGQAHVRVVHASPDAPAVDVAVQDGPVLFSNLAFTEAAGPSPVDAGTYDLEVRPTGTMTAALAIDGVQLEEGKIYTVMAVGLLNGMPELEALTIVDEPATGEAAATPEPSEGAGTTLPSTGTGPGGASDSSLWLVLGAVGAAGVALAGAGAASVSRKRLG